MLTTEWRKVANDPREIRLFEALEDQRWDWRTLQALATSSGMSPEEVKVTVAKYPTLIRESRSRLGEPIFTLRELELKRRNPMVKILDFMSNQSTSTMF